MRRWLVRGLIAVLAVLGAGFFSLGRDLRALILTFPTNRDILFWSVPQRDAGFRVMDQSRVLVLNRPIKAGGQPSTLPVGPALKLAIDVPQYVQSQRIAGLVVLHDGKVRLETYGLGFDANGKWTSFSVAKSLTSTLVGAAIKDGYIKSLDDKVTAYIADMKGSAYDDVTVAQLLTMTSGVKWNEDYTDRNSDVSRFNSAQGEPGVDATVAYMRRLPREAPAGSKWVYKTGETNLIGVLVSRATGKTVSDYLSEKIWVPYGMERDASWLLGKTGHEISGCCIQAATRDFARFGQFILDDGKIAGRPVLPDGWVAAATALRAETNRPGTGYGYQWWTYDGGTFGAQGIFGQSIFIDPKRKLVIATNGNWPKATDSGLGQQRTAFFKAVQAAIDAEGVK